MKKPLSSSTFVCCLVVCCMTAAANSLNPNLRGGGINDNDYDDEEFDITMIGLGDLSCSMLQHHHPHDQQECLDQGQDCESYGKFCYVISSASRRHYVCSSNHHCLNKSSGGHTTTTTSATTTPACLPVNALGCNPNPHVFPNCCAGSACQPAETNNSRITSWKCVGWSELMGGGEKLDE